MNQYYPQEYYYYYPTQYQYQPQFWSTVVAVMIDIIIIVALGAFALSQVKKAWKGEEVELPFK